MSEPDEFLEIKVLGVPEPFNRGRIVIDRKGAWIQVTVREGKAKRARRLYLVEDSGKELFQLLDELTHPATLPVWEPGTTISGYEPMSDEQETPVEDSPATETEEFRAPTSAELTERFAYQQTPEEEDYLNTVANYLRVCANALCQLCPADGRLEGALAALMEARAHYIAPMCTAAHGGGSAAAVTTS